MVLYEEDNAEDLSIKPAKEYAHKAKQKASDMLDAAANKISKGEGYVLGKANKLANKALVARKGKLKGTLLRGKADLLGGALNPLKSRNASLKDRILLKTKYAMEAANMILDNDDSVVQLEDGDLRYVAEAIVVQPVERIGKYVIEMSDLVDYIYANGIDTLAEAVLDVMEVNGITEASDIAIAINEMDAEMKALTDKINNPTVPNIAGDIPRGMGLKDTPASAALRGKQLDNEFRHEQDLKRRARKILQRRKDNEVVRAELQRLQAAENPSVPKPEGKFANAKKWVTTHASNAANWVKNNKGKAALGAAGLAAAAYAGKKLYDKYRHRNESAYYYDESYITPSDIKAALYDVAIDEAMELGITLAIED